MKYIISQKCYHWKSTIFFALYICSKLKIMIKWQLFFTQWGNIQYRYEQNFKYCDLNLPMDFFMILISYNSKSFEIKAYFWLELKMIKLPLKKYYILYIFHDTK